MPFSIEDFYDLVRLLGQHPEWRAELRRHLLPDELLEAPTLVRQLAQGQERLIQAQAATQTQIQELARAQAATQAQLDELTQAQARADQRLGAVEQRLDRLGDEQGRMGRHLGALTELVGAGAEVDAERTLVEVLRAKGYQVLGRPRPIAVNGEVDRAVQVAREGQVLWALVEAKARLHRADVLGWHRRLQRQEILARLRRVNVEPPLLPYAFGLTVYEDAEDAAKATGIGILDAFGERLEATPQ